MDRLVRQLPFYALVIALPILGVWLWWRCIYILPTVTTVYIVRHAEKADSSSDPPLSAAGQLRAAELARVLGDNAFTAVFTTQYQRTQQTAAPLAAAQGLTAQSYTATDTQGVANTILANHAGGRVLVVGHSTTVDDIAAALGAGGLSDLAESQFDRLFEVRRVDALASLERFRFGAPTQ